MSLSIGLAVGFAAAGAAGGTLLGGAAKVGEGLFGIGLAIGGHRGPVKSKVPNLAVLALTGSLAGGAFGYAAGEGYDYLTGDNELSATVQECYDNVPDGQKAVIAQDAIGTPICSYE